MFVIFFFSPSENHFTLQRLLLLHETRGIISLLAFKADINAKEISRSILNDHIIKKKKTSCRIFCKPVCICSSDCVPEGLFRNSLQFFFF